MHSKGFQDPPVGENSFQVLSGLVSFVGRTRGSHPSRARGSGMLQLERKEQISSSIRIGTTSIGTRNSDIWRVFGWERASRTDYRDFGPEGVTLPAGEA